MRAVLIAIICGVVGGAVSIAGGDWATQAHHVSNMEGGRAMLVMFAIAPAGALLGAMLGLVVALREKGTGAWAFAKALGTASGLVTFVAILVFGYAISRAPTPPQLDGHELNLEIEVRLPAGHPAPADPERFTVLFTSRGYGDDRHNAQLKFDQASQSDARIVIPGSAFIATSTSERFLVVNDGEAFYWFDLPLRAKPRAADTAWTEWWPKPGESATSDIHGNGGFQIRYRVQPLLSE